MVLKYFAIEQLRIGSCRSSFLRDKKILHEIIKLKRKNIVKKKKNKEIIKLERTLGLLQSC